jgi:hypothetical protein
MLTSKLFGRNIPQLNCGRIAPRVGSYRQADRLAHKAQFVTLQFQRAMSIWRALPAVELPDSRGNGSGLQSLDRRRTPL